MIRHLQRNSLENGSSSEASGSNEFMQENSGFPSKQHNENSSVESRAILETGICVCCGIHSEKMCTRCRDFYCSSECQVKDWPKHRFICFPMPSLMKSYQEKQMNEELPKQQANGITHTDTKKEQRKEVFKDRRLAYIPSSNSLPEDGSDVIITGFKSSNRCSIRSADKTTTEEYLKVLTRVHKFGESSSSFQTTPKSNSFALAQMNERWCRVQVLTGRKTEQVSVYFTDFGVISFKLPSELRKVASNVSSLPCYINGVQLHGVTSYSMDANILQQFDYLVNKKFKMEIVQPDDKGGNIKLYYCNTNKLVNSEIIEICKNSCLKNNKPASGTSHMSQKDDSADDEANAMQNNKSYDESDSSTLHMSQNSADDEVSAMQKMEISLVRNNKTNNQQIEKETGMCVIDSTTTPENQRRSNKADGHCMVPPFKTIPFDPQLKNVKVIVLDFLSEGFLSCIMESDLEHVLAATQYFENWKDNEQPYKPRSNEYCVAQFESEWFRAKVLKVLSEDRFLVSYIDFLNEGEVSSQSIRRYPMDLTIPCHTNRCGIVGLPDKLSDELLDYLQSTIALQTPIIVNKIHVFRDMTMIYSENLMKDLISRKLIQ